MAPQLLNIRPAKRILIACRRESGHQSRAISTTLPLSSALRAIHGDLRCRSERVPPTPMESVSEYMPSNSSADGPSYPPCFVRGADSQRGKDVLLAARRSTDADLVRAEAL